MFCGGGGVLDKSIDIGKLMVVSGAIRDDGFSYHYLEPSRIVNVNKDVMKQIENYLDKKNIDYFEGICWATDAFLEKLLKK